MKAALAITALLGVGTGAALGTAQTTPTDADSLTEARNRQAFRQVPAPQGDRAERLARQLVKERRVHRATVRRVRALKATLRHRPDVQEALTVASVAYAVPRGELSQVAWCESTPRPHARNGRYRGLFQFGPIFEGTPYGRAGLSVWSPLASAMAAAYIVRHGGRGWSPWECSPRGAFKP